MEYVRGESKNSWLTVVELENAHHRLFINQRQNDWDELLPIVEFQYNNHIHSATQNIPFLLDTGCIPRMGFEPDKAALAKSKDDMAKYYDRKRTPAPDYQPRDRVTLTPVISRQPDPPRNYLIGG